MPLIAVAAISAIGSAVAANQQKVAAKRALDASHIDIDALNDKTKQITEQNAIDSQNLFKTLNPGGYNLQQQGQAGLLGSLNNPYLAHAQDVLGQNLTQGVASPLLTAAIARAHQQLSMGGQLDPETQNLVTRTSLANSGAVGQGSGLGRDITARDLGLTSMQVGQQRLQNASQLGSQELGQNQSNLQALMQRVSGLQSIGSQNFGQYLQAAGLGNQLQQNSPQLGLSGSSIANLTQGQANAAGQYQQSLGNAQAGLTSGLASAVGQGIGGYYTQGGFGNPFQGGIQSYVQPQPYTYNGQAGNTMSPYVVRG